MTTQSWKVARQLRAWAEQQNLLAPAMDGSSALVSAQSGPPAEEATLPPVMRVVQPYGLSGDPAPSADVALGDRPRRTLSDLLTATGVQGIGADPETGLVRIYTRKQITRKMRIGLPDRFEDGSRIEFKRVRAFSVGTAPAAPTGSPVFRDRQGRHTCGTSIGIGNMRNAGTLGALVRDGSDTLFGLSCSHVIGGCGLVPAGMPILAPGVTDVDHMGDRPIGIGRFDRALPMVDKNPRVAEANHDAALFRLEGGAAVSPWQRDVSAGPQDLFDLKWDMETGFSRPLAGLRVEKVGRSTGHTVGVLLEPPVGPLSVPYNQTFFTGPADSKGTRVRLQVFFWPVFMVERVHKDIPFSSPGDSGALVTIVEGDRRFAFGMVLAGDPGSVTVVVPIAPILKAFGVTLVPGEDEDAIG